MMTELENKTMENKIRAGYELERIIHIAENEIFRANGIPILDNEEHADLIKGYADRIAEIRMDMEDLKKIGR